MNKLRQRVKQNAKLMQTGICQMMKMLDESILTGPGKQSAARD